MPFAEAVGIGIRQLKARRGSMNVALACLALCGAVFTLVVAITYGQDLLLRSRLSDVTPHITMFPERTGAVPPKRLFRLERGIVELVIHGAPTDRREIKPRMEISTRARRSSSMIEYVAPVVAMTAVYRNGARFSVVEVRGVEAQAETAGGIERRMLNGSFGALSSDSNTTVIGTGLAGKLGARMGSTVTMIASNGVVRSLRVVGIFRTDVIAVDDSRAYINVDVAQSIKGMARNSVNLLALRVSSPERVERAARSVERATGFRAATWSDVNNDVLALHRNRMLAIWFVAGMLLLASGFGIANALLSSVIIANAAVVSRDGSPVRPEAARAVVILQGIILGICGGVIAVLLALVAALALRAADANLPSFAALFVRSRLMDLTLTPEVFAGGFIATALVAVAASIAPALRAGRRS